MRLRLAAPATRPPSLKPGPFFTFFFPTLFGSIGVAINGFFACELFFAAGAEVFIIPPEPGCLGPLEKLGIFGMLACAFLAVGFLGIFGAAVLPDFSFGIFIFLLFNFLNIPTIITSNNIFVVWGLALHLLHLNPILQSYPDEILV